MATRSSWWKCGKGVARSWLRGVHFGSRYLLDHCIPKFCCSPRGPEGQSGHPARYVHGDGTWWACSSLQMWTGCGEFISIFTESIRAVKQKKKSMRSNKEQKHGCHFKMTSEFPSRLAPQSYLLRNRLLLLLLCRILNLLEKEKYQN